MEFTRHATVEMAVADIQRNIRVANLPEWCASIVAVQAKDSNQGHMTCLSGDYVVHRELLNSGVRFSIPATPDAVQWTLTVEGDGKVLVHCTANAAEVSPEMTQALDTFVDNWLIGLESWPQRRIASQPTSCDRSDFTMGGFG